MDASNQEGSHFHRTQNGEGTSSTRCLYCFRLVALQVELPAELDRLERRHICPEKALAQLRAGGLVPLAGGKPTQTSA